MSNIEMSKPFQERIFEKIKESIGELMTEEELKNLVEITMQKAFFEPTYERHGSPEKPPYIVTEMRNLMNSKVNSAVKEWFELNPKELNKIVDEQIKEGFTKMLSDQINAMLSVAMYNFGQNIKTSLGIKNQ